MPVRVERWVANLPVAMDSASPKNSTARLLQVGSHSPQARATWVSHTSTQGHGEDADALEARSASYRRRLMCWVSCALFQVVVIVPSYLALSYCGQGVQPVLNQALPVVSHLGADASVGWWSMPAQQPMQALENIRKRLYMNETRTLLGMEMSFGTALGVDAARIMYDMTSVQGVTEAVPEKLRGIYWVRGASRSQLLSFQYARWFAAEQTLIAPIAPLTSAWAAGSAVTTNGQSKGFMYQPGQARRASEEQIVEGAAVSFKFGACPQTARYCKASDANSTAAAEGSNMSYATMQFHPAGSVKAFTEPGTHFDREHLKWFSFLQGRVEGSLTLQEPASGSTSGAVWMRSSEWGLGTCSCFESGSSTLTKIIDASGEPMQPHWDQFAASKGKDPVYLWAGFPSEDARAAANKRFKARAMMG